MPRISYVNGRYLPHPQAVVHIEDRGYQFSDGVYEYIAFYNRHMLDASPHFARLERSLRELEIPMPVSPEAFYLIARELIERNGRADGGLYVQVTRGVARRDHPFPKRVTPSLVMTVSPSKLPKEEETRGGVKVITFPDMRWGRRDIKSISLLPNVLAKQDAATRGAREAWLVEEDSLTVSEGAASNAYLVMDGRVVTHHASERILNGITREAVLKLARAHGIPVEERPFTLPEIKGAQEAFLTSTSANILPVVQVGDAPVGGGYPGPVTRTLQELYVAHVYTQTRKQI